MRKRMSMNLEQSLKAVKVKANDIIQKCLQFNLRKREKVGICFRIGIRTDICK